MIVLVKIGGGIRPIAVGSTLHHLVAKVVCNILKSDMSTLLASCHLGLGVKGGAEAAIHAARCYIQHPPGHIVVKLDFMNAFNQWVET